MMFRKKVSYNAGLNNEQKNIISEPVPWKLYMKSMKTHVPGIKHKAKCRFHVPNMFCILNKNKMSITKDAHFSKTSQHHLYKENGV